MASLSPHAKARVIEAKMVLGMSLSSQRARHVLDLASTVAVISLSLAAVLYLGLRIGNHYRVQIPFLATPARVVVAAAANAALPVTQSQGVDTAAEGGTQAPPAEVVPVPSGNDKVWLPVLMYHYVRVAPAGDTVGFGLSVTPPTSSARCNGCATTATPRSPCTTPCR